MATAKAAPTLGAELMNQLKSAGWEDPDLMFRSGHMTTAGRLIITGATDDGDATWPFTTRRLNCTNIATRRAVPTFGFVATLPRPPTSRNPS